MKTSGEIGRFFTSCCRCKGGWSEVSGRPAVGGSGRGSGRQGAYGKENGEGSAHLRQGGSRACPRTRFPRCTWTSCPRTPESSSRCSCGRKTSPSVSENCPRLRARRRRRGNRQIPFFRNMSLLTSSHPGRPVASPRGSQGQPPRSPGGAWKVRFWPACSSSPPSKALGVRSLAAVVVYSLYELFAALAAPSFGDAHKEKIFRKFSVFVQKYASEELGGPREEQWGCPWDRASIGKRRRSRASRVARLAAGGKRERERDK